MCKGAMNLDDILGELNMDTSTGSSKPTSDMHLEFVKLKDAYLEFTEMVDVTNIGNLHMQPLICNIEVHLRPIFIWICASYHILFDVHSLHCSLT